MTMQSYQRSQRRYSLGYTRLPGRLCVVGDFQELRAVAVDVSIGGMGIASPRMLRVGEKIRLSLGDQEIELTVRHCRKDQTFPNIFRCGLTIENGEGGRLLKSFHRAVSEAI
jgi:hypothetical protein